MSNVSASLAESVVALIDDLPSGERKAAQALISNYPVLGLKTVAEFAAQAGVSSPTILRFISRLGYSAYAEFQAVLQNELEAQIQSPLSRRQGVKSGAQGSFSDAVVDNIHETFSQLSQRQIDNAAKLLTDDKARIYLAGGRFTDPLARYMAAHLMLLRPNVIHMVGQEITWRDRLVDISKRDVVVIYDIRRYQDGIVSFAEKAKNRGATIILMTDQWLSPAARFAKHVLAGRIGVPSPWDSSAALFVVTEALIAAATVALEARGAARMAEIESLR